MNCKGHFRTAGVIGISETNRKIYDLPSIVFIENCEWCNPKVKKVKVK